MTDPQNDTRDSLREDIEADFYRLLNAREHTGKKVTRELVVEVLDGAMKSIEHYASQRETAGRIDELKGLHNEGGEYELVTYISGEQEYVTERLATLEQAKETNGRENI